MILKPGALASRVVFLATGAPNRITWIGGNYMFNELAVGTQSLAVGVAAYPDWSEAPFVGK